MGVVGCKCRRWTQEERDYVEDKWGLISINKIAIHLGRSYEAVRRYAEKNKLGGSCFNDFLYTTGTVADILGIDYTQVVTYIKQGRLQAKSRKIKSRKIYLIEPEELEKFRETYKPRSYSLWTTLTEKKLVQLVEQGKTNKEIANILNKSIDSVANKRTRLMTGENE